MLARHEERAIDLERGGIGSSIGKGSEPASNTPARDASNRVSHPDRIGPAFDAARALFAALFARSWRTHFIRAFRPTSAIQSVTHFTRQVAWNTNRSVNE